MANLFYKLTQDIKEGKIRKIGIIMGGGIGNIITFTPMLKKISKKFPYSKIAIIGGGAEITREVLKKYPHPIDVIELSRNMPFLKFISTLKEFRHEGFDLLLVPGGFTQNIRTRSASIKAAIFSFLSGAKYRIGNEGEPLSFLSNVKVTASGKSAKEIYLSMLKELSIDVNENDKGVEVFFDFSKSDKTIEETFAREQLSKEKLLIVFHVSAGKLCNTKQWLTERWAKLAKILIEKHSALILFIGTGSDSFEVQNILNLMECESYGYNFTGKLSLAETASLLKKSHLLVCTNSGPMHIGAALYIPTVAISGASPPEWDPPYKHVITIRKEICHLFCSAISCKRGDHICMTSITVEDVLEAVEKQLKTISVEL